MSAQSAAAKKSDHHLWVSDTWYIPVDESGRCVGPCAEGALGFVVQLQSDKKKDYCLALKLPRLTGETHRENAYINDLMEKELLAVEDIMLKAGAKEGLLPTESLTTTGGLLRGQISTDKGMGNAPHWNGAIVLVHFEKGLNPRFCLIKKTDKTVEKEKDGQGERNKEIETFPDTIDDCPITTTELFDELKHKSQSDQHSWDRTVFVEVGHPWKATSKSANENQIDSPSIFNKEQALEVASTGQTWYTCVPSIAYWWAPGTLQESISLNKLGDSWGVRKHFLLIQRLTSGIYALHSRNKLHADLRPANIAYLGDPSDPNDYYLSDYGSFAEAGARAPERNHKGGTVLGPIVGTERASVFYAPERRSGREREAADRAVILRSGSGATVDIVLGWSNLIDKATSGSSLTDDVVKALDAEPAKTGQKSSEVELTDSLVDGDRIQIRDYIFDVIKAVEVGDKQGLRCREASWKIYHGRIVVKNTDGFDRVHWFPIPRTIELLRWSAATDLYSLGALFLYSVYRAEKPKLETSNSKIEEDFRQMLTYLESPPYFRSIWLELEQLRRTLEDSLTSQNHGDISALRYQRHDESITTLGEEAVAVVRRITETVPGTHRLVEVFDFNPGHFIFFIHFVLCCLHRRNHLKEPGLFEEAPFCVDRCEQPNADGGAGLAKRRLGKIIELIGDSRLSALKTSSSEIPKFDERPDPTIRVAYSYLSENYKNTIAQGKKLVKDSFPLIPKTSVKTIFDNAEKALEMSRSTDPTAYDDKANPTKTE